MKNRREYFKKYYLDNKPSDETRRALSLANVDKRRNQQQAYRDKLNPPSEKVLKRRAERKAYRAAMAAS